MWVTKRHCPLVTKGNSMVKFGQNIRKLRRSKEITLEGLAAASGLSITYIKSLEKGSQSPTLNTVFKIANALGASPEELLKGSYDEWLKEEGNTQATEN